MVLYSRIAYRIINFTTNGRDYSNKWPHYRVRWGRRCNLACKPNKQISYYAYGPALTNIVLYIRTVRIWYTVRIYIDYRSYIVRISRKQIRYRYCNCPSILWHLKLNITQFSQQSVVVVWYKANMHIYSPKFWVSTMK